MRIGKDVGIWGIIMIENFHGGDVYSREIMYDFSANINPLGMPDGVKRALINNIGKFERYPDIHCTELRRALSAHECVCAENIVCGNGAADLIYRAVQTLKPKRALIPAPTFSEYERALSSVDCHLEHYFTHEEDNFSLRGDILQQICGMDMMFICNPNNPVGNLIDMDLLGRIIKKCAECGTVLIIDECFIDFVEEYSGIDCVIPENTIILKAFTKIYAMAGLRLGYMLCGSRTLADKIQDCGQCWSVSVPAQIAGIAALDENDYVLKSVALVTEERLYLSGCLKELGFKVYPSSANFILFKCQFPLDKLLLKHKIAIRNCSDYIGLGKEWFRVAVMTHEKNQALIAAIERCIQTYG